ncbi:MAG: peroxidase-related enzyme [Pseudomonadota bacterium]
MTDNATVAGDQPTALDLPMADPLDEDIAAYFAKCVEKLGMVPNVLRAYAFDQDKLRAFMAMYNDLMLGPSGLSKLEREMIAVVVSCANRCFYCLAAHGQAVRHYSGDPKLGEILVMNYRAKVWPPREKAMLDFAWALTTEPHRIEEKDRSNLRLHNFSDRDIWDVAAVVGFFNMSNRVAIATDMRPNDDYHGLSRTPVDQD